MYNGFTESAEKIEERKQKILDGYKTPAKPMDFEAAYYELRHALLGSMLVQVTQLCDAVQNANERLDAQLAGHRDGGNG